MHRTGFLHKWMSRTFTFMHAARIRALSRAVEALLAGGRLTLTELGRARPGQGFVKHSIKAIDRLLGNPYLAVEREAIYAVTARMLLRGNGRPVILIDWADCNPGHRYLMLRAAVAVPGRTVSIYEEVHPLSRYNAPRTHRRFLEALGRVLPSDCHPILVTDAGFRGPWFQAVEKLGWDWVGRVRNMVKCSTDGTCWRYTEEIYKTATTKPRYLGQGALSHKQPYRCYLYLVRSHLRGPGRPKKSHGNNVAAKRCRKLHKDPWLIATSLPHTAASTRRVFALYASRMKIEEGIRDTKSHRFGFAMHYARSERVERLQALLLIGLLATLVCCLQGLAARTQGIAHHFQANTEHRRTVLSLFFLGRHLLRSPTQWVSPPGLKEALRQLPRLIAAQQPTSE
jgi:hypothetical protein